MIASSIFPASSGAGAMQIKPGAADEAGKFIPFGGMADKPGRFVHHQQVGVLVKDVEHKALLT